MDQEQVEKRLDWLDDQVRKALETADGLQIRISESIKQIESHSKQLADQSDEMSRLAGLTTRIHEIDDTLQKHRKEVSRQLETAEKRRTEKETNIEAMRKADQQSIAKRIDEIAVGLKEIENINRSLDTRRDEELRISKQLSKIEKQIEKLVDKAAGNEDELRNLIRARDQHQKEAQKLSTESGILRKKSEELQGKVEALADSNRALDTRVTELVGAENERAEAQARWVERQDLNIVEFENEWKKWGRRFDAIELQATNFDERLAAYEEMHRALKQMRIDLGELMDRLERRITEVSEMQRLNENRMKQEWSSFQADDLKRWNTYKLTTDESWREHDRLHGKLADEIDTISKDMEHAKTQLEQISDADRQRLSELFAMMREWISEVDSRSGS